ncbi:hypothetical protein PHLCEN_2v10836 [Hermanssonia centrifuga]|uniref:Asparagine-linked glycosylation protein 2 n=1 Tax=Hermanssonia centrifuga TaxID=98765 RepID=A0A2R6NM08_9APHY|nr:hypothetical protein PHLCEN_2v10836 [Hermanssonia centrifuga]
MALKAFLLSFLFAFPLAFCAPLDESQSPTASVQYVWVTEVVTSDVEVLETSTILVVTSLPLTTAPPTAILPALSPASTSISSVPPTPVFDTVTDIITLTATVTPPPLTITVSAAPTTVTEILTNAPIPPPVAAPTAWTAPAQMTDLDAFNVSSFAYGQHNMKIVDGIPAAASATTSAALALAEATSTAEPQGSAIASSMWDNSSTVVQLFYPAGSINPGSEPQGGADFYASPLDLSQANNVTLEYSVFFPAEFDWALAGKLPGLYGGHRTCSGGDDALSCFSTRLMWREGGAGELYLYAPKDKQTEPLCSTPPLSVCDADYGLSVGRGSFNFTPGAWTHVKQTVTLNTPGQQDGGFVLEVDGSEVINRMDVFYRDVPSESSPSTSDGPPETSSPPMPPAIAPAPVPSLPPELPQPQATPGGLSGILGPLLNGLQLFRAFGPFSSLPTRATRNKPIRIVEPDKRMDSMDIDLSNTATLTLATTVTTIAIPATQTVSLQETVTVTLPGEMSVSTEPLRTQEHADEKPVQFTGKFHILLSNIRQLHLTAHLLWPSTPTYDVYFVDQLSTCVPLLRNFARTRVVFYCHFPDKLLADGEYVEGRVGRSGGLLKRIYRFPVDWLEEVTTRSFEKKKNAALAVDAFALLHKKLSADSPLNRLRLVLAGGYDPRVEDNMMTLMYLIDRAKSHSLTYDVIKPSSSKVTIPPLNSTPNDPSVLFLLNFTTAQRSALLSAPSTLALLYTPTNEHFGIGPVEAMICGVPVVACNTGGPTESVVDSDEGRTGWLRAPDPEIWAETLVGIVGMGEEERRQLSERAKRRAKDNFGMEAMAISIERALKEAVGMGAVPLSWTPLAFIFALIVLLAARSLLSS